MNTDTATQDLTDGMRGYRDETLLLTAPLSNATVSLSSPTVSPAASRNDAGVPYGDSTALLGQPELEGETRYIPSPFDLHTPKPASGGRSLPRRAALVVAGLAAVGLIALVGGRVLLQSRTSDEASIAILEEPQAAEVGDPATASAEPAQVTVAESSDQEPSAATEAAQPVEENIAVAAQPVTPVTEQTIIAESDPVDTRSASDTVEDLITGTNEAVVSEQPATAEPAAETEVAEAAAAADQADQSSATGASAAQAAAPVIETAQPTTQTAATTASQPATNDKSHKDNKGDDVSSTGNGGLGAQVATQVIVPLGSAVTKVTVPHLGGR
jgi:hypothetical protein